MYAPATSAYRAVCNNVIANDNQWHVEITHRTLHGISGSSYCEQQRGFALAAGACGDSEISNQIVDVLCDESNVSKDVEVRRNCVASLGNLPIRVLNERIVDVLHDSVEGWKSAIVLVLNGMVEQCCSKFDRTREVAGHALKEVCLTFQGFHKTQCRTSSVTEKLCNIFGFSRGENTGEGEHSPKSVTFAGAMRKALSIPEVSTSAIRGFISAGGGMGQQSRLACRALISYLGERKDLSVAEAELGEIAGVISNREGRLLVPALNTLDYLLKHGVLRKLM